MSLWGCKYSSDGQQYEQQLVSIHANYRISEKKIFQEHRHVDLFMDIGLKNPNEL